MSPRFADPDDRGGGPDGGSGPDEAAVPLHLVAEEGAEAWLAGLPAAAARWLRACGFAGRLGQSLAVPDAEGGVALAAVGLGGEAARARQRFAAAAGIDRLPPRAYRLATGPEPGPALDEAALGWLLAGYRYDRLKTIRPEASAPAPRLVAPEGVDARRLEAIAAGEWLTRDLINAPASHMGPAELADAARALAGAHGAAIRVLEGAALEEGFPLIHAVGRASARAPRLIDMAWGQEGPRLTLVGKGVCFDTGGLDIKPAASMALMKKDMGGAATVLGLASTIMALGLSVRLRVLIPAMENAIDGSAMRPGDVLSSRRGLSVEVNNTDAEGRLVLADALALAAEEPPDLLVSMATLTGAARVAVGPDLAPFFTDDEAVAQALAAGGEAARDPVWRLPFHAPYEAMIEPDVADLDNAPKGGFAGAVTAALFLRRFAGEGRYLHFDIYGWQPQAAPARPKGGVGQGARALLAALPAILGA